MARPSISMSDARRSILVAGNPYFGITSRLPVILPESELSQSASLALMPVSLNYPDSSHGGTDDASSSHPVVRRDTDVNRVILFGVRSHSLFADCSIGSQTVHLEC